MLIQKFKGLISNVDGNDVKLEYLKTARNLRLTDKCASTRFYDYQHILLPEIEIEKILFYDAIELDNDPLQSEIVNNTLVPSYRYGIEEKHLMIVNSLTATLFYLDNELLISPFNKKFTTASVYQDKGFVLILLDGETYWLGKLNRNCWYNGLMTTTNVYYIDRYLEPFDKDNPDVTYIGTSDGSEYAGGNSQISGYDAIYNCNNNRRLGFHLTVEHILNQNTPLQDDPVSIIALGYDSKDAPYSPALQDWTNYGNDVKIKVYKIINDKTGEAIYSPTPTPRIFHGFWMSKDLGFIHVPKYYFKDDSDSPVFLKFNDGTDPDSIWPLSNNPVITSGLTLSGEYYVIPANELETRDLNCIGTILIGTDGGGFSSANPNYELIVTSILDDKEEIITEYRKGTVTTSGNPRYGLKINTIIPININKRLTGIGYYIRFNELSDYKQLKVYNLLNKDKVDNREIIAGEFSLNGIELVQRIGTLFNVNSHILIHSFDHFARVNNLPYMISNNQVYGGIAGNGQILDLFYPSNRIPNVTNERITFLSNLNDIPAIHDSEKTTLLMATDSGLGSITYSKRDVIGLAVKNQFDIAVSPDAIALHTKEGIYTYNGSSLVSISKEIDDIVENYYSTGKIFFNPVDKELYYFINDYHYEFYRYSFIDKTWTTHSIPEDLQREVIDNASNDHDGSLVINTGSHLYKIIPTHTGRAQMITHLSDLGRPRELKSVKGFRIDFVGTIAIFNRSITVSSRSVKTIYVPVDKRFLTEKTYLAIDLIDNAELYGIGLIEETITMADDSVDGVMIPSIVEPQVITPEQPIVNEPVIQKVYSPIVFNISHTWAVSGVIDTATNDFFMGSHNILRQEKQVVKLKKVLFEITTGTSVTLHFTNNGTEIPNSSITIETTEDSLELDYTFDALENELEPVIDAVSGDPENLKVTVSLEHTVTA